MEPIRVLQAAVIVLTLPVVLGVIGFVGVNLIGRGISDPTAVGGLATEAAVLTGVLFMLAFGLGLALGVVALIWGSLKGDLSSMRSWAIGFCVALMSYGVMAFVLSRGPKVF
jgi:hypothetical protein